MLPPASTVLLLVVVCTAVCHLAEAVRNPRKLAISVPSVRAAPPSHTDPQNITSQLKHLRTAIDEIKSSFDNSGGKLSNGQATALVGYHTNLGSLKKEYGHETAEGPEISELLEKVDKLELEHMRSEFRKIESAFGSEGKLSKDQDATLGAYRTHLGSLKKEYGHETAEGPEISELLEKVDKLELEHLPLVIGEIESAFGSKGKLSKDQDATLGAYRTHLGSLKKDHGRKVVEGQQIRELLGKITKMEPNSAAGPKKAE